MFRMINFLPLVPVERVPEAMEFIIHSFAPNGSNNDFGGLEENIWDLFKYVEETYVGVWRRRPGTNADHDLVQMKAPR